MSDYFQYVAIGWWLVAKESGETGFISNEYLKPYTGPKLLVRETASVAVSQRNLEGDDITWMQYVVVEDYATKDPRQLSLRKNEILVVIEKSEDGKTKNVRASPAFNLALLIHPIQDGGWQFVKGLSKAGCPRPT